MKLIYFTSKMYPSSLANSIQTFWMAKTFSEILGGNFLFILARGEDGGIWSGIPKVETGYNFSHFRIPYYFFWFIFSASKRIERGKTVVYCRDFYLGAIAAAFKKMFGYKIAFEYHDPPFGSWRDWLMTHFCDYLIPTSRSMREYLARKFRIPETKFFVAPNGVDVSKFHIKETREECREKLGLPKGKKIVLYSGHLYAHKGAHVLAEVAKFMGEDYLTIFVGGVGPDIQEFKARYVSFPNIYIAGYRLHEEIPLWLRAADVLVIPQSAKNQSVRDWSCPLKIFEYMAAGVPMIASDLPAIREVLHEGNAFFVKPDDQQDLADKITDVFLDYKEARTRAFGAWRDVQNYTWQKRAHNILEFINKPKDHARVYARR